MYNFTVNFADLNIGITTYYADTFNLCKEYLTEAEPDFSVKSTEKKISEEVEMCKGIPSPAFAETTCIYREIAERLPFYNRFIFHGAAISYKNMGFVFTAPSGTGKSTHISLWRKYLGNGVEFVNGDKPIIRITDNGATIYSTPYAGKEGWQNYSSAPLKAVCIVNRGTVNKIEKIGFGANLSEVIKQVYMPFDANATVKTLELINSLSKIPLYFLSCDMSEEAVKTSFEEMCGLSYDECKI